MYALTKELSCHLSNWELMNVLEVVYAHYWVVINVEALFPFHLEVITYFYCVPKKVSKLLVVIPLLDKLKHEELISLL
jgi:hypothetical protein